VGMMLARTLAHWIRGFVNKVEEASQQIGL
jgi:hypothetical protein